MNTSNELKGKKVRLILREAIEVGDEKVSDISGTWGGIEGGLFTLLNVTGAMNKNRVDVSMNLPEHCIVFGSATNIGFLVADKL